MTEYSFQDLAGGAEKPAAGIGGLGALGGWSPQNIQNILLLVNSLIAQFRDLRAGGGITSNPQDQRALNPGNTGELTMGDLKKYGKGLLQLARDRLGDKTTKEILDLAGDLRLSDFEKML